jgi:hypothetical protein
LDVIDTPLIQEVGLKWQLAISLLHFEKLFRAIDHGIQCLDSAKLFPQRLRRLSLNLQATIADDLPQEWISSVFPHCVAHNVLIVAA